MEVEQITYVIDWDRFIPGSSFFIPCLDPKKATKIVMAATTEKGFKVYIRKELHEGISGLRVWCT